jgi:porin
MQSRRGYGSFITGMFGALVALMAAPVYADDQPPSPSLNSPCAIWSDKNPPSANALLGNLGGLRPVLGAAGINLGLLETSEVLGNLAGGVHRGADYAGVTEACLTVDLGKKFGIDGGTINISAFQIHGRSLTADDLHALQTASDIEADRATRLWEAWYQQYLGGGVDVRLGQQSLDQEFMVSQFAGLFVNAAMGWPVLPSEDLYAGGPAYPLSSLGGRIAVRPPNSPWTVLAGVFDDNPPGGPFTRDSQLRAAEAPGTQFNLSTGALFIAEVQYAVSLPSPVSGGQPLPGTYKLGGWIDTGEFPDQRFDAAGLSLADPLSTGVPLMHRGNFSFYALADQTVWRDDQRAVGVFIRAMGAPGDRNLVDFSFNAGVDIAAPLPGRTSDSFGIAYGLAKVSAAAAALGRDTAFFTGASVPARSVEQMVEITYQIQATSWWVVQPDLQFIANPGGGIANPDAPTRKIGDEFVAGVQTKLTF